MGHWALPYTADANFKLNNTYEKRAHYNIYPLTIPVQRIYSTATFETMHDHYTIYRNCKGKTNTMFIVIDPTEL